MKTKKIEDSILYCLKQKNKLHKNVVKSWLFLSVIKGYDKFKLRSPFAFYSKENKYDVYMKGFSTAIKSLINKGYVIINNDILESIKEDNAEDLTTIPSIALVQESVYNNKELMRCMIISQPCFITTTRGDLIDVENNRIEPLEACL